MITGKYREDLSPEARNARPFVHLLPTAAAGAPPSLHSSSEASRDDVPPRL
jgi:hypothetical protein